MRRFRSVRIIVWLLVLAALITLPSLFGYACFSGRQAPAGTGIARVIPVCAAPIPGHSPYPGTPFTGTPGTLTPGSVSPVVTTTP